MDIQAVSVIGAIRKGGHWCLCLLSVHGVVSMLLKGQAALTS